MSNPALKQELIEKLDQLSEQELTEVQRKIDLIRSERHKRRYDPAKDAMLKGLFEGPPDLAERSEEILWEEFGIKKDDRTDE